MQFWAFLIILHDLEHFLDIFCVLVWSVLFCKLFPSLCDLREHVGNIEGSDTFVNMLEILKY